MRTVIVIALLAVVSLAETTAAKSPYIPEVHGTIRAKYEYEPEVGKGRFVVRNARVGIVGKIVPIVGYKAEIDLCDEGKIKMLDAYVRVQPVENLKLTLGQMRVPFAIEPHRSPHLQFFANRSFLAKHGCNIRDVGLAAAWTFYDNMPITLEGGVFNGSGITNQKDFWTNNYNFSFKAQTLIDRQFNITLSCMKAKAGDVNVMMYNAGAFWDSARWHIEAEYLRKHYEHGAFSPVNAVDAFAAYRIPLKKKITAISFLGRYDYMSDHSKGSKDDSGNLMVDDPERHRLTGGVTLSLGKKSLQADIRLNYEQYFYAEGVIPAISEQNKLVVELVAHF